MSVKANEERDVLAEHLIAVLESIQQRGVEPGSLDIVDHIGMADVTGPGDQVRNFRATKERMLVLRWRYDDDGKPDLG